MNAIIACFIALICLPSVARATLVCEANLVSLDFGQISVRDGLPEQTSGSVTIFCSGGVPNSNAVACVQIGAGSGGSGPGQTPRYMTGLGTTSLEYQLTAGNTLSGGGNTWETASFSLPLDATGSATIAPVLYAEITSIGAQATVGSYDSDFASGGDVLLAYGETACTQYGTASAFTVRATVAASCTVSVSNMDFGTIDATVVAPVDQTAIISLTCTNASFYTVGLNMGGHPEGTGPSARRMINRGNVLAYGLYHDPAATAGWGLDAGNIATGMGTGGHQTLTVFGRIFPDQFAVVGIYSDTVVVVVNY
ncbi:Csu type fimbrial protein [Pseudorhodobacter ferrugineus]|uniref:Csu type fimbrial protein n=1 Tax=Pseudorhodobacter ferrugineus TaxID=77008 RepID=UPI0003B48E6F|nr:spore coat U domain-containing protein [Pseudorhodobacter ferrugineus]